MTEDKRTPGNSSQDFVSGTPSRSIPPNFEIDWWTLLTDPDFLTNPYPELNRIRELGAVHYDPTTGIYFILNYRLFSEMATTTQMGRDTTFWRNGWNSPENRLRDPETYAMFTEFQPQMINVNAPDHRRMRGVFEKAFRPASIANYIPLIQDECDKLIKFLPVNKPFDFMSAFANPLPHRISLKLFDIPEEMDEQISEWIAALSWLGNIIVSPEQKRDAQKAQRGFKEYIHGHLASHARESGTRFIDLAIAACKHGTMNEEEMLNNVVMLISGSRTSLTLLGNGLFTLLKHPDQFKLLRENRELMRTAIEEMLRYEPGSSLIPRAGIADFQCGEIVIPAGSMAISLVGAINRDPERFENPEVFDVARQPKPNSAFGGGAHICIGKALARYTGQVAFNTLMDHFEKIEFAGDPAWWTDRSDQRGLSSLPIQIS